MKTTKNFTLDLPKKSAGSSTHKSGQPTKIAVVLKQKPTANVGTEKTKKSTNTTSTLSGPQDWTFDKDEMIPMPTDEQAQAAKDQSPMEKQIQVTLNYNSSILGQPWMLLMECVEDRICGGKPQDKDADYWFHVLNNLGHVPFKVLAKDRDRFFVAMYAAAHINHHELWDSDADARNPGPSLHNPDWDPTEENPEQDGKHWGMKMENINLPKHVPKGHTVELPSKADALLESSKLSTRAIQPTPTTVPVEKTPEAQPAPVREQVQEKKVTDLKEYIMAENARRDLMKIRDSAPDVYAQKWLIAERMARGPKEAWEDAPFELREMVKFCYGWLQDTGEVPYYPQDLVEIWWKRPTQSVINIAPEAIVRRDAVVAKVRGFWQKSVAAPTSAKINIHSESYRVTLAAMKLEQLIEAYANGEDNDQQIRDAAVKYFHAHFPIETLGVKPGPNDTLDPDYPEYISLCQKYNLTVGTLLHEAQL